MTDKKMEDYADKVRDKLSKKEIIEFYESGMEVK